MRVGVIGAGSWGTTLANLLAKKGLDVVLWVYEADLAVRLAETGVNDLYLPEVRLDRRLRYTHDLKKAAAGRQVLLLVPPSQVLRNLVEGIGATLPADCLLVSAAKGIENETLLTMSEV